MFLLLKDKPKKFCSLIFLRMVSNYYSNYIELVITNNFRIGTYVGRRRVCPSESVLQLLADSFPMCLSFQCSTGNCHFIFHSGCCASQNKIPSFFSDRGIYKNLFCGKFPTWKGLPATALLQWKQKFHWHMKNHVYSLEHWQNRLNLQ